MNIENVHASKEPLLPQACLTVSAADAATQIGISYALLLRLIKRRKIRVLPHLRHKRILVSEVERFVKQEDR